MKSCLRFCARLERNSLNIYRIEMLFKNCPLGSMWCQDMEYMEPYCHTTTMASTDTIELEYKTFVLEDCLMYVGICLNV